MALYQFETRIRYTEVDSDGFLNPIAAVDLFQNCTTFQSEDLGIGVDYLKEHHRAWFLTSWQLCINRMPKCGDRVTVQTWSTGIRLVLGNRNFRLLSDSGEVLCYANSIWAYINTDTLAPVKCPEDEAALYGESEPLKMELAPRKISLPDGMIAHEPFEVKYYFIDTNHHMNNAKYVQVAQEYLPDNFKIREIRCEFKRSAILHDIIHPMSYFADGSATIALTSEKGEVYSTVQFLE